MFEDLKEEIKLLYHICFSKNEGQTHSERMENYFGPQAKRYDHFRKRLLHGREELYSSISIPEGGIWVELGGGTGQCLEFIGDRIHGLKKVYLVDLSPSLIDVAKDRVKQNNWKNVECLVEDASTFKAPEGKVDVFSFSYSLSMMPPWFEILDNVKKNLKPEGQLGIIDFYLARKHPIDMSHPKQSTLSRHFWPLFFMGDDVFPNMDHLPYILNHFLQKKLNFGFGPIPYTPLKAPWYSFIGTPK